MDDHYIVRRGVRHILQSQNDWEVVGEASNGREAVRMNELLKPDAIVMDITMPEMNGLDATKEIVEADPNSKVLILTMHDASSLRHSVQKVGAKGLIRKSEAIGELTPALTAIIAGKTYFH